MVVLGLLFDLVILGCLGVCLGFDVICCVLVYFVWEEIKYFWMFLLFECLKLVDVGDFIYLVGDLEYFIV